MPIEQSRLLAVLSAAEDGLSALGKAEEIVRGEFERTLHDGMSAEAALSNIRAMVSVEGLLMAPLETRMVIALERERMNPRRVKENERRRVKKGLRKIRDEGMLS